MSDWLPRACADSVAARPVFEEFQAFLENYGDLSTLPTRFFCGKPDVGEECQVFIESGKMLIVKLLAVGAVSEKGTRGELRNGRERRRGRSD